MPSVSKAQQKLMGQAWAVRKGELKRKDADPEAVKLADSDMKDKDMHAFAKTKHKGLPDYVKEQLLSESKTSWNEMTHYAKSWIGQEYKKDDMLMVVTKMLEGFMQELTERLSRESTTPKERKDAEEVQKLLDEMMEIALD